MSEQQDKVARALAELLIYEYPTALKEELDRACFEGSGREE